MSPESESSNGQEVSGPDGSRIVGDQDGNVVVWNAETGEVTTAMGVTDPEESRDDSTYDVSDTDLQM